MVIPAVSFKTSGFAGLWLCSAVSSSSLFPKKLGSLAVLLSSFWDNLTKYWIQDFPQGMINIRYSRSGQVKPLRSVIELFWFFSEKNSYFVFMCTRIFRSLDFAQKIEFIPKSWWSLEGTSGEWQVTARCSRRWPAHRSEPDLSGQSYSPVKRATQLLYSPNTFFTFLLSFLQSCSKAGCLGCRKESEATFSFWSNC